MEKTSGNQTGFTKSKYHCEVRYCSTHQIHHTCALSISVSAPISKQTGILEDCLSKYSIKFSGPCQIPKLYSKHTFVVRIFFFIWPLELNVIISVITCMCSFTGLC